MFISVLAAINSSYITDKDPQNTAAAIILAAYKILGEIYINQVTIHKSN
jgi:hypothetical protein